MGIDYFMIMTNTDSLARQRILKTASDLFYRQGYHATGINQIIKEADVSKATFYVHFPSKDDLCLEYVQDLNRREQEEIRALLRRFKKPLERFLAPITELEPWMKAVNFRGCSFQNIIMELTDPRHPVKREAQRFKDAWLALLKELTLDLVESSSQYAHLDVDAISQTYFLLYEGAMVTAELYGDAWPIREARKALLRLIGED